MSRLKRNAPAGSDSRPSQGNYMKRFIILAAIATASLSTAPAFAWNCSYWSQHSDPNAECYVAPTTPGSESNSTANADSNSRSNSAANSNQHQGQQQGQAQGQIATGGDATATGGNQHQTAQGGAGGSAGAIAGATGGDSNATSSNDGNGNGNVQVGGDTSEYRSKAYALSLPGLVAAPAVATQCMRHSRGWGGFSAGATGGTFFDKDCMTMTECFNFADRFVAWGRVDMAMAQLEACGSVKVLPQVKQEDNSANLRRIEAQKAQTKAGK